MRSSINALLTLCLGAAGASSAGEITGKVDATPEKYLAETVVYLENAPGTFTPKTHKLDQKKMSFVPHILTITAGDTIEFLNSDGVDHNVYTPDNEGYNLGMIASKQEGKHTFDKPGVYSQLCSVHPEMLAYVVVGQNPFAAVVDKKGHYKIKGVPPGEYKVLVWNSHLKAPPASVTVGKGKTEADFSVKR